MQRFIIGISALVLSAIVTPAFASDVAAINNNQRLIQEIGPVTLVQLAYQGYFKEQGIPSHAGFETAVNSGKVTPRTLIQSAIEKGRLSPETLNNRGYLNTVKVELQHLDND